MNQHYEEEDELKSYLIDGKLERMSHKDAAKKQFTWMVAKSCDTIRSPKKIFGVFKSLFYHFLFAMTVRIVMMYFSGGLAGGFAWSEPISWS